MPGYPISTEEGQWKKITLFMENIMWEGERKISFQITASLESWIGGRGGMIFPRLRMLEEANPQGNSADKLSGTVFSRKGSNLDWISIKVVYVMVK